MKEYKPIVLILQSFGIGDVIFCQNIARFFMFQGREILWPVNDSMYEGLRRAYPDINFCRKSKVDPYYFGIKEMITIDGYEICPIRWSDTVMEKQYKDVMWTKHAMYGLPWSNWKEHAMWKRDQKKEAELMNIVGADKAEPFTFVNCNFGGDGRRKADIAIPQGKVIEMRFIEGFSLFDWAAVMLAATEIHSVSTSLLYMFELLPITNPIHLYVRKPIEKDFSYVDYLFTKPYILHA
jgi:hypothetical protein